VVTGNLYSPRLMWRTILEEDVMDRDVKSAQFSTWFTLENVPVAMKDERITMRTRTEAVNVLANKYTGVYRNNLTQEFVFVAWYYDMPFEVATLKREMWRVLSLWAEETIGKIADAWSISDFFSLCGSSKKKWGIVREALSANINDKSLGSVVKWY